MQALLSVELLKKNENLVKKSFNTMRETREENRKIIKNILAL